MPLETASFISQLNPSNPALTDPLQQGQNHITLIKSVLIDQFPNLGTVTPVTATAESLNLAAGAFLNAGTLEIPNNGTVAGAEMVLDGIAGTGTVAAAQPVLFLNSGTAGGVGALSIEMAGTVGGTLAAVATLSSVGDMSLTGKLSATTILQAGSALLPPGVIVDWYGTIASIPAGWALCNGQTVNGFTTPDLRAKFVLCADGTTYLPGQTGGAASVTAATDTAGAHTHGGTTGSAGGVTPTGTASTAGSHSHTGATGGHALTVAELAPHHHQEGAGTNPGSGGNTTWTTQAGGVSTTFNAFTADTGNGDQHTHPISADGDHTHPLSMNAIPAHQHSISSDGTHMHNVTVATLPPFYALAKIMKVS